MHLFIDKSEYSSGVVSSESHPPCRCRGDLEDDGRFAFKADLGFDGQLRQRPRYFLGPLVCFFLGCALQLAARRGAVS